MPPTPRITSPTLRGPSAGELGLIFVMAICLAVDVSILSLNIHPRAPVDPRFQSCVAPAGIESPFVKSGRVIFTFGPAAQSSGEDAMSRAGNRVSFVIMTGVITKEKGSTFLLLEDSLLHK